MGLSMDRCLTRTGGRQQARTRTQPACQNVGHDAAALYIGAEASDAVAAAQFPPVTAVTIMTNPVTTAVTTPARPYSGWRRVQHWCLNGLIVLLLGSALIQGLPLKTQAATNRVR